MKTPAQRYLAKIRRKPASSESALQQAIVRWCRGTGAETVRERFCAIPNGWFAGGSSVASRAIQGKKLKAEGVRAGMPDLLFWGCFGDGDDLTPTMLWIELKNGTGGTVSPAQKAVHKSLRAHGHQLVVARDFMQAVKAIIEFFRTN